MRGDPPREACIADDDIIRADGAPPARASRVPGVRTASELLSRPDLRRPPSPSPPLDAIPPGAIIENRQQSLEAWPGRHRSGPLSAGTSGRARSRRGGWGLARQAGSDQCGSCSARPCSRTRARRLPCGKAQRVRRSERIQDTRGSSTGFGRPIPFPEKLVHNHGVEAFGEILEHRGRARGKDAAARDETAPARLFSGGRALTATVSAEATAVGRRLRVASRFEGGIGLPATRVQHRHAVRRNATGPGRPAQ